MLPAEDQEPDTGKRTAMINLSVNNLASKSEGLIRTGLFAVAIAWILLGASHLRAQEYRVTHCLLGCPQGVSEANHLVIRAIYALSYNTDRKSADWVAYQVTADTVGIASSLSRQSVRDDFVSETLSDADFATAETLNMDRAQYAPLVSFAGTPYWNDVNYLTNAVARSSSLSRGAWNGLDWAVRNLVNREGEVYVVTGPIFKADVDAVTLPIATPHRIPDGFFKIVLTTDDKVAAFRFEQNTSVGIHHCNLRASIAELEAETGLTFFPEKTRPLSESLYSSLGCF